MTGGASLFVLGSFVAACTIRVERLPAPGESLAGSDFALEAGGKGLNLAVAARRLGAAVDGLFAIGDDALGELAEPALRAADLPLTMLRRRRGPTGAGVGFIAANGETALAVSSGANGELGREEARAAGDVIGAADLTMAQFEIGDAPILEAFRIARGAGRFTLLNPSPFRPIDPALLAATSILIVNAVEADRLGRSLGLRGAGDDAGADEAGMAELATAVFARGPERLAVTLGGHGALLFTAGRAALTQAAFPVTAVDTLGAGDAFAAALATSVAERRDDAESLRRACASGALVASAHGVFDALPTRAALDAFLAAMRASDRRAPAARRSFLD